MKKPSPKPVADSHVRPEQLTVMLVLISMAALGAERVLNATNILATIAGWVSLVCGTIGFVVGVITYVTSRGGCDDGISESKEN